MGKAYRSRSRLVMDLLGAILSEGPVGVTRLSLLANLSHPRLQEHLDLFRDKAWVLSAEQEGRLLWSLTEEGRKALENLKRVDDAMKDFGMNL